MCDFLHAYILGHDNFGNDAWFLEKVEIYDSFTSLCYMFFFYDWIDLDTNDCLYRDIDATVVQCSHFGSESDMGSTPGCNAFTGNNLKMQGIEHIDTGKAFVFLAR